MSPSSRLVAAVERVSSLTSITRTRSDDDFRFALHDGVNGEVQKRVLKVVARLEQAAADLEKALA